MQWITDSKGNHEAKADGVELRVFPVAAPHASTLGEWGWRAMSEGYPRTETYGWCATREEAEAFAVAAAQVVRIAAGDLAVAVEMVKARAVAGLRVVA
jgi:hypothetical protein